MVDAVQKNTGKSFFSGVLLLSVSTVLVKIIGLIYKIPMLTYLGSEGMGYFNSAYEIYALFCVISTAGLPVALSVLISEAQAKGDRARIQAIYRAAMTVFVLVGVLGSVIMLLFARRFCLMIKSESAYWCILSISPTVFLVCISSALRGYFQGFQKMLPTAFSQILESVGKLVFGIAFARFALQSGFDTPVVAAFAGLGLTLGTALSLLYLCIEKRRFHPYEQTEKSTSLSLGENGRLSIWKSLARLAIPMTLGASLVSFTKLIDMTMILRRLQAIGYSSVEANAAYGGYTTLALSVYGLLPALVNAVALPLVPMLSAAIAVGDRTKQAQMIRCSYLLTNLFAIPASLGVSAYAKPILSMLFGRETEAVALAAPLLSYLGISVFLSCMITATNSVLHAYQVVNRPILSMLGGAIIKIITAYFLIGNIKIGIFGAPISTFFCNATVVLINLAFCSALCPVKGLARAFFKPLLSAAISVGSAFAIYSVSISHFGEHTMITLLSIALAGLLYLTVSCLIGVLDESDFLMFPMGERLLRLLKKIKLFPPEKRKERILK